MNEDENVIDEEITEDTQENTEEGHTEEESTEDYRTKLNIQNRILKKEGYEFKDGKWVKEPKAEVKEESTTKAPSEDTLSGKDALLLAKAGVDMEDLDEVTGFAKYRGITIKEALEDKTLKTILAERVEERKSAQVAQTKGPRGTSKETPEQLIDKARSGNEVDPDKLAEARMAGKLAK